MKKVCIILLFMSISILYGVFLTSCHEMKSLDNEKNEGNVHVHSFNGKYLFDENAHWQECSCGTKSEMIHHSFKSDHMMQIGYIVNEKQICSVCQYEVPLSSHQHTYSNSWSYDESIHYHKATCEHTEERTSVEAHTFSAWMVITAATEEHPGVQKRICKSCNYEQEKEIPALLHQHTYSNSWSYDESIHYHKATCEHAEERTSVEAHTFSTWMVVTESTEEHPGIQKRVCKSCNYEQQKEIPALEHRHVFSNEWIVDVEPSCGISGSKSRHCITCGEKTDRIELPASGHSYTLWQVDCLPTVTSSGVLKRVCQKNCTHEEIYVLPHLNESDYQYELIEPTCEMSGFEQYIFLLDDQEIEVVNELAATGHQPNVIWDFDDRTHWTTCKECKIIIDDLEHEFDDNDTCTICGYIHNLGTPGLYYILTGDGSSYAVEKYFGIDLIVEIPEKHNNLPVTRICEDAFYKQNIVEVQLPSTMLKIGERAFSQCFKLSKINFPDGLIEIGNSAFSSCFELKEVGFPNTLQFIGDSAFSGCFKLKELNLPDSVVSIGASAFNACQGAETIKISKNVNYIGSMAFQSCFDVTLVEIPGTVKVLNSATFAHCNSLETVIVSEGVEELSKYVFGECKSLKEIVLPKSLTQIADGAFDNCETLHTIYFTGVKSQWDNLVATGFKNYNCSPKVYTYSITKPLGNGNCWYYDENQNITKW